MAVLVTVLLMSRKDHSLYVEFFRVVSKGIRDFMLCCCRSTGFRYNMVKGSVKAINGHRDGIVLGHTVDDE